MAYSPLVAGATTAIYVREPYRSPSGVLERILRVATAIAMGITASAPFRGVDDENLAIAYISTLLLVFVVRLCR